MNVAHKEAAAKSDTSKPWIKTALDAGRKVPQWIADLPSEKKFLEMMALRERAFPKTR